MKRLWLIWLLCWIVPALALGDEVCRYCGKVHGKTEEKASEKAVERDGAPPLVEGMENLSLNEDGNGPSFCVHPAEQCAFKSVRTGLYVSSIGAGLEGKSGQRIVLRPFKEVEEHCKKVRWAGFDGWRLPSFKELAYLGSPLMELSRKFPAFGGNNAFFWTDGFKRLFYQDVIYDKSKAVAWHVASDRWLNLLKTAKATFRCVRNESEKLWEDVSVLGANPSQGATCTEPGVECFFRHKKSGLIFMEPTTYYFRRPPGEGVDYSEATVQCEQQNWQWGAAKRQWRLPTYEEALEAARSMFYGYSLSRDGMVESLHGRFWVKPPVTEIEPDPKLGYNQAIVFKGYVCDFQKVHCERLLTTAPTYHNSFQPSPALPRANVLCVTRVDL